MEQIPDWETLIASRMRPCATICTIEDPRKRNRQEYNKRYLEEHPDKKKEYQQRNKKNIKRWEEEHHDRRLELNRIADRKRAKSERRIEWTKDYLQRPEVKARRAEQNKARELNPERIAWKKAYEEKRKNDPKRIAYKKAYNERKRLERQRAGLTMLGKPHSPKDATVCHDAEGRKPDGNEKAQLRQTLQG